MRIQRGSVTLKRSRFIGNTATLLGGSIFVDIEGELKVWDTYFENVGHNVTSSAVRSDDGNEAVAARRGRSVEHQHAQQGDIIYSDGKIKIAGVRLVAVSSSNGLSVFRHSGSHWSLAINDVSIRCPVGYDLRTTNSTAYGVSAQGLRRSYYLDQLSYYCESCPRNRYSLDYGYLNYTMIMRDFVYFTLLINGSRPKPSHIGTYDHHKIRCLDCPHGGQCDQGIVPWPTSGATSSTPTETSSTNGHPTTAMRNLARNRSMFMVRFQHCPKGYCRSSGPQLGVGSCADRREGPLCGRCGAGFSEAWFSTICVPNESCGPPWLYPFTVYARSPVLGLSRLPGRYQALHLCRTAAQQLLSPVTFPTVGQSPNMAPNGRHRRMRGGCACDDITATAAAAAAAAAETDATAERVVASDAPSASSPFNVDDGERLRTGQNERTSPRSGMRSSLPCANVDEAKSADDDDAADVCGNVIPPDNNAAAAAAASVRIHRGIYRSSRRGNFCVPIRNVRPPCQNSSPLSCQVGSRLRLHCNSRLLPAGRAAAARQDSIPVVRNPRALRRAFGHRRPVPLRTRLVRVAAPDVRHA
jgi:hypothetical protein